MNDPSRQRHVTWKEDQAGFPGFWALIGRIKRLEDGRIEAKLGDLNGHRVDGDEFGQAVRRLLCVGHRLIHLDEEDRVGDWIF